MSNFVSVWREDGEWFALGHDDLVYQLHPAVWDSDERVSNAFWEVVDAVTFPTPGDDDEEAF